jgi:hypothetical protein
MIRQSPENGMADDEGRVRSGSDRRGADDRGQAYCMVSDGEPIRQYHAGPGRLVLRGIDGIGILATA